MTLMSKTKMKHRKMSPAIHLRAQCKKYTFDDPKLLDYVRNFILSHHKVLNLPCGQNVVVPWELRVDEDTELENVHLYMKVERFIQIAKRNGWKFDVITFDPPFDKNKSKKYYNGRMIGEFTRFKNDLISLLEPGGIIIALGYEVDKFGKKRGMRQEEVILVNSNHEVCESCGTILLNRTTQEEVTIVNSSGEIRPFYITIERKVK